MGEDLNRADAQRLRAHLEAMDRTQSQSRAAPCVWPYAGGDGDGGGRSLQAGGARVVVAVSGECDRAGADRLHDHLEALLSMDVVELRVDLTELAGGGPARVAWALGCARNSLSTRGGTFTVLCGRRLIDTNRHVSLASAPRR